MTENTRTLTLGEKYLYIGQATPVKSGSPLVFIGIKEKLAQFIADDQALYDLLGEAFSKSVFNDYVNKNDINELVKSLNVISSGEIDAWLSQDEANEHVKMLEAKLHNARMVMAKHKQKVFYATDCPGGEVYMQLIKEFKKECVERGLPVSDFTFHGFDEENTLSISHNGSDVESDSQVIPSHSDVLLSLKKNEKYARINIKYMYFTNTPELN